MKKKTLVPFPLLFILLLGPLPAQEQNPPADDFGPADLIAALEASNGEYQSNEAAGRIGLYTYRISRANLLPVVTGNIPLAYTGRQEENYTPTVNSRESDSFSAAPELTISQVLPTAGILTASAAEELSGARTLAMDPAPLSLSEDPSWTSSLRLSAGLSQPLYFGKAYAAGKTIVRETYTGSRAAVLAARNELIQKALGDYYELKQARFTLELVNSRLETDRETYKRVEREYELGLWTKSVLYQALSTRLKSEADLLEAEQQAESLLGLFTAVYGLSESPLLSSEVVPFPRETRDYKELLPRVLAANPQSIQLQSGLNVQEASLVVWKKDQAPVLNLGGSWSRSTGLEDNEARLDTLALSLTVSASLFDGGTRRFTGEKMQEELFRARTSLSDWNILLENQTRTLTAKLERSEKLTRLYDLQIEAADYEYQKGLLDLELGQITKKELSALRLGLENALLVRQQNRIDTNLTYLQLLALLGEDLRELPFLKKEK